ISGRRTVMVSSINFGNFATVGGKTVGNGMISGMDTQGIIEALVTVRSIPVDNLNTKLTGIDNQQNALNELRTLLTTLQNTADILRNPPGFNNAANNIFEYRQAF